MEKWKDIPGYDGMYQVSDEGRVRSWKRHAGRPGKRNEPVILKQTPDSPGYLRVSLWNDGVRKMGVIHRLVPELFIPNPENKEYINHLDGNKFNNNASNLRWSTPSENALHAYDSGLRKGGRMSKVKAKKLKKDLISGDLSTSRASELFSITAQHAKRVLKGECWANL